MNTQKQPFFNDKNYFQELQSNPTEQTIAIKKSAKTQFVNKLELNPYVKTILANLPTFQPTYKSSEQNSQPIKWKESIYEGQLKNGIPEGEGVLIKPNGTYMHGSFKGGISNGKFRIISTSKYTFQGNLINDRPEGEGQYKSQTNHFKGKFTIGLPTGEGQESYNNGQWIFKGTYQMGVKKNGLLKWGKSKDNLYTNYYEGHFDKEGKFDGMGTLKTIDGTYKGQFKNGLKQGKGQFYFSNGCRYEGSYKRDQKNGEGTFFNGNKSKWYSGGWHRNMPHGRGQFFTKNVSSGVTDVVYGIRKDELQQSK